MRKNGDITGESSDTATTQTWGEKRRGMSGMIKDPLTGELRLENKQERFARLANHRVNNAIKRIGQLRSLANRVQYDYTADEVNKIVGAVQDAVNAVRTAFAAGSVSEHRFKL